MANRKFLFSKDVYMANVDIYALTYDRLYVDHVDLGIGKFYYDHRVYGTEILVTGEHEQFYYNPFDPSSTDEIVNKEITIEDDYLWFIVAKVLNGGSRVEFTVYFHDDEYYHVVPIPDEIAEFLCEKRIHALFMRIANGEGDA